MPQATTSTRALAIVAGAVFLAGTAAVLFEDVLTKGAPIGLKHAITGVVLAGTFLTGHLAAAANAQRHRLAAFGFALVFICGTGLVVYGSVGRQADTAIQTAGQIELKNDKRLEIKRSRAKSQAMLDDAQTKLAAECKTGDGKSCKGIKATIEVYTAAVKGHDADLERLGAPKPIAPEAEQLGEVAAAVFGADKAKVKAAAVLVVPFLQTGFLEFGSLVCFGFGFAHRQRPARPVMVQPIPLTPEPVQTPVKTLALESPVVIALRNADRPLSNGELAAAMRVSAGQASKLRREVAGLVREERAGKTLRLSLH